MKLFAIPSRCYLRMKLFGFNFTFNFAHVQTLEGITSLQPDGKHIILWDLENCSQEQAEESLRYPQKKHILSNIYLMSDIERSYRGFCYSKVDFKTYLKILLDTKYLDWNFFDYTVRRKKATLE
jgi:hypothetical protein